MQIDSDPTTKIRKALFNVEECFFCWFLLVYLITQMNTPCTLTATEQPDSSEVKAFIEILASHNNAHAGPYDYVPLIITLKNELGEVVGGLKGYTIYRWLSVEILAVSETVRGQGYGAQILKMAEDVAKQRGCIGSHLDTFSFQAPGFYAKCGYLEIGRIADFPIGAERIYLQKKFQPSY